MSGAELRLLRIPYCMIRVYKIAVLSAKNDVYRTGRFHFGSTHRPVDGVEPSTPAILSSPGER